MKNSKSVVLRRRQALLQALKEADRMEVGELAENLAVSATTIRRDLAVFENQHLIERFHGGAKLRPLKDEDSPGGNDLTDEDLAEKKAIARYAASLVADGDTIFINSSSTAVLMLDYLTDKKVIVVTNSTAAVKYPKSAGTEIILTGGELHSRMSLVGEFALNTLSKIIADKAFIGVGGISAEAGITTSVLPETAVNDTMLSRSQGPTYVLAAKRKIGREHNFRSSGLDKVTALITGKGASETALLAIKNKGVDVVEV